MSVPLDSLPPNPLEHEFSESLSEDIKAAIAVHIWGEDEEQCAHHGLLEHFFAYYIKETTSPFSSSRQYGHHRAKTTLSPIRKHSELLRFVSLLKSNPQTTRKRLADLASSDPSNSSIDVNAALDLSVKIILMISCISARNIVAIGHIFRPQWRNSETLEQLVLRVLPRLDFDVGVAKVEAIRAHKLRFAYVASYAKISIEWTDNLPDHLCLQITEEWKTLKLFKHVGILELALRSAARDAETDSVVKSLNRGCIPALIAAETLRTLRLLFPDDDLKSRALLKQEMATKLLDPRLTMSFQLHSGIDEYPEEASVPSDIHALFVQFPHFGERLYKLLKEVENPTPMTWYEKWSERRSAPRYTYWAGVIALALALFFGISSIVLGALQVWVSFCSSKSDATGCQVFRGPRNG